MNGWIGTAVRCFRADRVVEHSLPGSGKLFKRLQRCFSVKAVRAAVSQVAGQRYARLLGDDDEARICALENVACDVMGHAINADGERGQLSRCFWIKPIRDEIPSFLIGVERVGIFFRDVGKECVPRMTCHPRSTLLHSRGR